MACGYDGSYVFKYGKAWKVPQGVEFVLDEVLREAEMPKLFSLFTKLVLCLSLLYVMLFLIL